MKITHRFPLDYIHEGTVTGNGKLGLSVWGIDRTLNISIGVSGMWDHRGGSLWEKKQNLADLRTALESKNIEKVRELFTPDCGFDPVMENPSHVPVGRLVIELPGQLKDVTLDTGSGIIEAVSENSTPVRIALSPQDKGCFCLTMPENAVIRAVPAWNLSDVLKNAAYPPPEEDGNGFFQQLPADEGFQVRIKQLGNEVRCRFARGNEPLSFDRSFADVEQESCTYWKRFQEEIPQITTPEPLLNELFHSGLFKFEAMTMADGAPAGLQGPWIEDDAFPPWGSDYHFNINVQMCYWPAFCSGRFENLLPMFNMLLGWKELLRSNAKCFVGIDDGCMIPHAVDDHCVRMGCFWTGAIDHASAAWMAQMMFDYVRYSGNRDYLKQGMMDFMKGVFNAFCAMMEEDENGNLVLPVSVSPEYRGAAIDAYGKNASFQLAAVHRLIHDLIAAAEMLQEPVDPRWLDVRKRLPRVTTIDTALGTEFALWQGQALEESHRHHSHLGGICPFNTIQVDDPELAEVVNNSRKRWIASGFGKWAGWSMPWAVMLHNRFGHREMAIEYINIWKKYYCNKGGGTLHDPLVQGISTGLLNNNKIMQMDACMGMIAAIADLFAYETGNVVYLLHGVPDSWETFEVKGICLPGGFKLNASRKEGRTTVEIIARRAGEITIDLAGKRYTRNMKKDETSCIAL